MVTREELEDHIWGHDTFVDFEHGLNTAVKRLREALERRLRKRKKRVATKVPKGEREKRLVEKKRASQQKRLRSRPED